MSFFSFTYKPFRPRATEAQIEALYEAAKLGLEGDALAHAANIEPAVLAQMRDLDPMVALAEEKGRAEGEKEMSQRLHDIARRTDQKALPAAAKASIAILERKHGWAAKQQVDVNVDQRISIKVALDRAKQRLIDAEFTEVQDALPAATAVPIDGGAIVPLTGLDAMRARMAQLEDDDDEA